MTPQLARGLTCPVDLLLQVWCRLLWGTLQVQRHAVLLLCSIAFQMLLCWQTGRSTWTVLRCCLACENFS